MKQLARWVEVWCVLSLDLRSHYKSLWLGPLLITWTYDVAWSLLPRNVAVGYYPNGS